MYETIDHDSRFSVIGYGSWATTLVGRLTSEGNRVSWHIPNPEVRDGVLRDGSNPKYVSDMELDTSLLDISGDVNNVVEAGEIIILATPSAYLESTLAGLKVPLKDKFVLSAIKGIIPDECATVLEYLSSCHGVPAERLGLISGPTHAEEVSRGRLSFLTAACQSETDARVIADRMGCKSLRIGTSTDVRGIEYASVLKNIYALASGMASGMGYGDNSCAVLIAACAGEMQRFLDAYFPLDGRDTSRCSYLGDLLVTCYSNYSRNRRLGVLIGRGCSVKSALNEMTMVAEGYFASKCVHKRLSEDHKTAMPIAGTVYRILHEGAKARKEMDTLFNSII